MNRLDSIFAEDLHLSEMLSFAGDDGLDDYFSVNEARESDKIHLFENVEEEDVVVKAAVDDDFESFLMDDF